MGDSSPLTAPLNNLSTSLTALKTALHPLLTTPTTQLSSPLPLLDKAKLHVLTAYAIDSLLFAALRLQPSTSAAADARAHPVFAELARTRSYFEKIRTAETGPERGPRMRVDREAVGRFVRAGVTAAEAGSSSGGVSAGGVRDGTGKRKVELEGESVEKERGDELEKKKRRRETGRGKDESKCL
jgi:exosome complex protein LRP1